MPKLRKLKGREVIKILKDHDFEVVRVKGSHHFLRHADGRCTVVPVHAGEIVSRWVSSGKLIFFYLLPSVACLGFCGWPSFGRKLRRPLRHRWPAVTYRLSARFLLQNSSASPGLAW